VQALPLLAESLRVNGIFCALVEKVRQGYEKQVLQKVRHQGPSPVSL
jgi:hypothetical protein